MLVPLITLTSVTCENLVTLLTGNIGIFCNIGNFGNVDGICKFSNQVNHEENGNASNKLDHELQGSVILVRY